MSLNFSSLFPETEVSDFYLNLPEPLNSDKAVFTLYGRNGLNELGKQILSRFPQRKTALLPSYSCGDEIEALTHAGFQIKIYRINPDLQCDIEDLTSKLNDQVGVVLATHYFGFPQKDIEKIKTFVVQNNSLLIEDCAHAIGGKYNDIPLGTYGDVSIFSLRKFLPVPHGGALLINNPELNTPNFDNPSNEAVATDLFIYLGQKNNFFPPGTPIKKIYKTLQIDYPSPHGPRLPSYGGYNLALSNLAKKIIKNTDITDLIRTRIDNFNRCLKFFNSKGLSNLELLNELPDGIVPSFFPLQVVDSEETNNYLNQNNLFITQPFWSYLHEYVDWNEYSDTLKLKQNILVILITNKIENDRLEKLALLVQK